jgi:hypothetical protein
MPKEYTPLLEQMSKLIGTYEGDDGNEYIDEDWDLHIPLCQKLLRAVADHLVPDETMTKKDYKKIPPPELIQKWCKAACGDHLEIIIKAAEWGYRQRCLEELSDLGQEMQVPQTS